jgi:hypothetical protein
VPNDDDDDGDDEISSKADKLLTFCGCSLELLLSFGSIFILPLSCSKCAVMYDLFVLGSSVQF